MGPWETEVFLAPIAAYCTSHRLHKGQGWSVLSAVNLPARELWLASHCPYRGMEGRPDGFALRFGLPRCMLGPSSYPLTQLWSAAGEW